MTVKDWLKTLNPDQTTDELQEAERCLVKFYTILAKSAKIATQNAKN